MKKIVILALSCLVGGILIGLSSNASAQQSSSIPSWVKSTAKYWVSGDVSDSDFIKAIQWMVTNGIIVLPNNSASTSNSNTQTTVSTMTSNPLSALLPTVQDLGSLWKSTDQTLSSKFSKVAPSIPTYDRQGNVISTSEGQPTYTIEQTFQKSSTPLTVTTFTIDMASFSSAGMSTLTVDQTSSLYSKVILDYQSNHVGYTSEPYVPLPVNKDITCGMYTYGTTQSTPQQTVSYEMICVKNTVLFTINAVGSDIGMTDDLKSITDDIINKIN